MFARQVMQQIEEEKMLFTFRDRSAVLLIVDRRDDPVRLRLYTSDCTLYTVHCTLTTNC